MNEQKESQRFQSRHVHFPFVGDYNRSGFISFIGRWILQPITRLTRSVEQIKEGNLDLVVKTESRDEMGRLSEAFNEMAASRVSFDGVTNAI